MSLKKSWTGERWFSSAHESDVENEDFMTRYDLQVSLFLF